MNNEQTIDYSDLTDEQVEQIDNYPEETGYTFYVDGNGEVHAIADNVFQLFLAQGGPDAGWQQVIMPGDLWLEEE